MNNAPSLNPNPSRGNRFVGGCLITLAVVLVILAVLAWWFVGRPLGQVTNSARELARIGAMDVQLTNRAAFTPPPGGELEERQVERYLAVLESIRDDLQSGFASLETRYEQIGTERPQLMDIPRLAGAYAEFIGLIGLARESQIRALNEQGFSEGEYTWTRRQVLRAAGLQGSEYDIGNFLTALGGQNSLTSNPTAPGDAPQANLELVQSLQPRLGELGVLAVLGF